MEQREDATVDFDGNMSTFHEGEELAQPQVGNRNLIFAKVEVVCGVDVRVIPDLCGFEE